MQSSLAFLLRCAVFNAAITAWAVALSTGYTVERLERIEDWPLSWVSIDQNEREDYTIRYGQTGSLMPKTVTMIAGVRHVLEGFTASDVNNGGIVCGRLLISRGGAAMGVVWSPASSYTVLEGSTVAYPHKIADDGTVGGSINHFYTPCVWRKGVSEIIQGAQGLVGALHPSGLVAGYMPDGGHGDHPWIFDGGTVTWPTADFAMSKAFDNRRLLGNYRTGYTGRGLIFDPDTEEITYLPGGDNNLVSDMNESGTGVGILSFGFAWETTIPIIWKRIAGNQYEMHDPYHLMERGWSHVRLIRITNSGVILGHAVNTKGHRWLIRLRPIKRS